MGGDCSCDGVCICPKNGGGSFLATRVLWSQLWDVGFAISALVLSVWIVALDHRLLHYVLWLELWMSKLSSSDVAHKYKSYDGQNGSFSTLAFAGEAAITLLISDLRTSLSIYLSLGVSMIPGYEYGI